MILNIMPHLASQFSRNPKLNKTERVAQKFVISGA
jgi:hypothetical protein